MIQSKSPIIGRSSTSLNGSKLIFANGIPKAQFARIARIRRKRAKPAGWRGVTLLAPAVNPALATYVKIAPHEH